MNSEFGKPFLPWWGTQNPGLIPIASVPVFWIIVIKISDSDMGQNLSLARDCIKVCV